jgi:hypothetical protein
MGKRYDREAPVAASSAAIDQQTLAHTSAWLRELGAALLEVERRDVVMLNNGRGRLTDDYPLGPLFTVLVYHDAIKVMAQEDAVARDE